MDHPRFQRILCPTDFSPFAGRALDHAAFLGRLYGGEIEVLHIFPMVQPVPNDLTYTPTLVRLDEKTRRELGEDLHRFVEASPVTGVPTTLILGEGDPANAVLERARTSHADLIVMGTHGLRGFDRWILGSVTQRLLRKAACPVLTVPPEDPAATERSTPRLDRILCPVEIGEHSEGTLAYAVSVARASNATLVVLHVRENEHVRDDASDARVRLPFLLEMRAHIDARERGVEESLAPGEVEDVCGIERIVVKGRAHEEILRLAGERGVDLIVMGIHRRRPLEFPFFGSTAQHVLQRAKCCVLTVRPQPLPGSASASGCAEYASA
jgi:nucleotide-binding universal stress UspA family protein